MRNNRKKIFSIILSVALLVSGGVFFGGKVSNANEQTTEVTTKVDNTNGKVSTFNLVSTQTQTNLTMEQLKAKATSIIPGTIMSYEYDYDMGKQTICFKIIDKNGVAREIELEVSTGKVYDIDYDYDNNGNRFINQSLFEVNKNFEECQKIALGKVPGGVVVNHKQDADYGLFIYEFIIKGTDGLLYEVDVETKNGVVIKVELEDDYNPELYNIKPVVFKTSGVASVEQLNGTQDAPAPAVQPAPAPAPAVQPAPAPAPAPQPAPAPAPAPAPSSGGTSEASLRQKVLASYPGTVLNHYVDYDDGMREHNYTIKQGNGNVVKVEISEGGWITDVDFEGRYVNGVYYDEDYYDWD